MQKIISRAGVASRRRAEEMIAEGRVSVNGVVEREPGVKADASRDEVRVNGKLLGPSAEPVYLALHKPEGYVSTVSDPEGRPTVMDLLRKVKSRVFPVGRLDYDTSGLLILTNDGELTNFLTRPASEVEKIYQAKLKDRLSPQTIEELKKGPAIGGPPLRPARVNLLKYSGRHTWLELIITQGRTRQIRRMGEAVGHPVQKLKRVAVGPVKLGDLSPGEFRYLTDREVSGLKRLMAKKSASRKPSGKSPARGKSSGKKK
ncbi:MAG: pseudouridine synthase [bacterium]